MNFIDAVAKTDYKFLIEQTFLLDEMEKRYPELFLKVARYIKEGKIEIAGGEYLMADTMLPTGETLIREILVGKRYVKEKFGVDVPVMWQADSFGMNAQLPQIYKKLGYKYVAFRRGVPERSPSEFIWHGLDGTKILTHWMPLGYRAGLDLDLTKLDDSYNKLKEVAEVKIATPSEFFDAVEKEIDKIELSALCPRVHNQIINRARIRGRVGRRKRRYNSI